MHKNVDRVVSLTVAISSYHRGFVVQVAAGLFEGSNSDKDAENGGK